MSTAIADDDPLLQESVHPVKLRNSPEEILREEVRSLRDLNFKMMQWGVSLLATLETALYFVRRESKESLVEAGRLKLGDTLPAPIYYVGTVAQFLVAFLFLYLSLRVSGVARHYRKQLPGKLQSGILELEPRTKTYSFLLLLAVYLLIPVFDFLKKSYGDFLLAHHWL